MMRPTYTYHHRMGGKGKGGQLRRVLAQNARIFPGGGFGVDPAHNAARGVGLGHDHARLGGAQMVKAEHLHPRRRPDQRDHSGILQEPSFMQHKGRAKPRAIPGRAAKQRHRPQATRQGRGKLILAHRKPVHHEKGKLALPCGPRPRHGLAVADQLANQRLRLDPPQIGDQQG